MVSGNTRQRHNAHLGHDLARCSLTYSSPDIRHGARTKFMRKFKNFNGSDYITDHIPFSGWTALGQLIDAHGFDKAVVRSRTFISVFQEANEIGIIQ